jgi:uncharacterized protein YjbJ (UPF0337 family)
MKALPWIVAGVGVGLAVALVILNQPEPQTASGWDSIEDAADRTWRWGSKSRFSGAGTKAAGKLKEGLGRVTGDPDLADEGVADQAAGTLKDAAGQVAHAVAETIHDLNR